MSKYDFDTQDMVGPC